jgi:hypothetical protein
MKRTTSSMKLGDTQMSRLLVGMLAAGTMMVVGCGDDTESGTSDSTTTSTVSSSSTGQDCPDPVTTGGDGGSSSATTGSGGEGGAASTSASTGTAMSTGSGSDNGTGNNEFSHPNDPGETGQKDPFQILKERADEGPPEVRSRLHGCTKPRYSALGEILSTRGVTLTCTATAQCLTGQTCTGGLCTSTPDTASELYANGKDALGIARLDAREPESNFHTTSGATKLFDIFIQAAPEVIARIETAPACQLNGVGKPMFDAVSGKCVKDSLSCIMGRPATSEDVLLCDLILSSAAPGDTADLTKKRNIAVATFLSAAHTCE